MMFVCSLAFYKYKSHKDKKNIQINISNNHNILGKNEIELIHTNLYNQDNSNISDYFVYFVIFLYILSEFLDLTVCQFFGYADFWMAELIVMAILTRKMFKIKIY